MPVCLFFHHTYLVLSKIIILQLFTILQDRAIEASASFARQIIDLN